MNDHLSWLDIATGQGGLGLFLMALGLVTILVVFLFWAIRHLRKTFRWYMTRGHDEEKMEQDLNMEQNIVEEYLEGSDED